MNKLELFSEMIKEVPTENLKKMKKANYKLRCGSNFNKDGIKFTLSYNAVTKLIIAELKLRDVVNYKPFNWEEKDNNFIEGENK